MSIPCLDESRTKQNGIFSIKKLKVSRCKFFRKIEEEGEKTWEKSDESILSENNFSSIK